MKKKKKKIQSLTTGLSACLSLLFLSIFGEGYFQKPEDTQSAFRHYDNGRGHGSC